MENHPSKRWQVAWYLFLVAVGVTMGLSLAGEDLSPASPSHMLVAGGFFCFQMPFLMFTSVIGAWGYYERYYPKWGLRPIPFIGDWHLLSLMFASSQVLGGVVRCALHREYGLALLASGGTGLVAALLGAAIGAAIKHNTPESSEQGLP
jgi:hypothetical protein